MGKIKIHDMRVASDLFIIEAELANSTTASSGNGGSGYISDPDNFSDCIDGSQSDGLSSISMGDNSCSVNGSVNGGQMSNTCSSSVNGCAVVSSRVSDVHSQASADHREEMLRLMMS